MTIINANTRRAADMIRRANNYEGYSLNEVYGTYSAAKGSSWSYCRDLCRREGGTNFRIISHNTFGYSVAWDIPGGVRIETAKSSYLVRTH